MAICRQEDTGVMAKGVTLYAPSWDNQWLPPDATFDVAVAELQKAFEEYCFKEWLT